MLLSNDICYGLIFADKAVKENDLCTLRGLTVSHKYTDYKKLEWTYHDLVSGKFECDTKKRRFPAECQTSWRKNIEEFKLYSN